MYASVIENIDKLLSTYEHSPLFFMLIVGLFFVAGILRWLSKNIKGEHLFQHTINNKMRFIKNELSEGLVSEREQAQLTSRYITLLNQKIYGVKNSAIQQEVIKIIDTSSEITNFRYFAVHQYTLSLSRNGRLYFNREKINSRFFTAIALLICSLCLLALGFLMIYASLFIGLMVCTLSLILYFAGLDHFPASPGMRKRAEEEIEKYYQHCNACDSRETEKNKPALSRL